MIDEDDLASLPIAPLLVSVPGAVITDSVAVADLGYEKGGSNSAAGHVSGPCSGGLGACPPEKFWL